jgi:hypothetical protein
MSALVESADRSPVKCVNFGLVFAGIIISAAGVVMVEVGVTLLGLLLSAVGLVYFLTHSEE